MSVKHYVVFFLTFIASFQPSTKTHLPTAVWVS